MRRIAARILGVLALVAASAATAQDYSYHLYIDRDVNTATGCSETIGATTYDGAELRLTANVTGTTVSSVTRSDCVAGNFGPVATIGGPHPVGLNNGTNGADVIELSVDRNLLGGLGSIRLALAGTNAAGTSTDTLNALPGGGAILQVLSQAAIPTFGILGLVLLIGALLFVASRKLKLGLASLGALLMAGSVWAANFVVDGQVGDWAGVAPLATDAAGDATGNDPGSDLVALFGAEEGGRVFYRIDVVDVENQAPVAQPQALTFLEDSGPQAITLTATDGDGDPLTYAIATNPTKGVLSGFNPTTGAVTYTPNANAEGADSFTFTANDGMATSAPATINIMLTPVNDAPVANDATFSTPENTPNGTNVGTPIVATDVDTTAPNNTLTYAITGGNTGTAFAINASTGQISVLNSAALDFKVNPTFTLTVTVTDGGAGPLSDTATVTINLGNVNEPPVFQSEPYVFALPENSIVGTVVGQTPALDQDLTAPNNTLTWAITSGNGSGAFAINAATGEITVANSAPLDFETTPSFTLGISVTDGGTPTGSDTSTVTINLSDVNEAPVVTGGTFTLPENSANATPVGTATATDVDLPPQTFTWSITAGDPGGAFAIAANGAITVANSTLLDFETTPTYTLTVQATDNGTPNLSGTATVTVNLTNVNEAPVFQAEPYTANVAENAANGTAVTSVVTATDVDAATTLTYAITGGNTSGAFAIDAGTGAITVANSAALDFKINPSFTLNLSVTDNGAPNLSDTSSITITVGDVNEAPVFQSEPYAFSIDENVNPTTPVGNTPATDQDTPPQTLTWAITGGNTGGTFAIDPATGAITVAIAPDFETTASYTLNISVTDNGSGNLSDTSTVTITITNVNEAPVNTVPAGPLATGVSVPLAFTGPNSISIADVDAAAGAVTTTVSTTLGTFSATAANGAVVTGSGTNSVSITDIVADVNLTLQTLSFTSASGGSATVTVLTNDNGFTGIGGAQTATDMFQINVDAAPTVTGATPAEAAVVANNPALSITFSENITTINGNAVTLSCNGGPDLITGGATGANVAGLTPTYAGTLPSGSCVMTVIAANVTDVDAIDPPDTMAVNFVRNFTVDAAPTVTSTTPANGAGNVAANATITVNFSENVNATLGAFGLDCGAGAISLTPNTVTNANTVTMTPGTPLPATSTCTLTVNAANVTDSDGADQPDAMAANFVATFTTSDPAPTVTTTLPVNGGTVSANSDITINFSEPVTFADASFTLSCPGAFAFVSSGSGTATATLNPTGNLPVGATCTVVVDDLGIADVDAVDPPNNMAADYVFTFTPVNIPPTLTAGGTLNYTEDAAPTAIDTTITVSDPDSANLASATAQITGNYVNGQDVLSFVNTPNITAVFTPASGLLTLTGSDTLANYQAALRAVRYNNTSNTPSTLARTVTWIGSDGIAASTPVTSTINVTATNDAPVLTAGGVLSYTENQAATNIDTTVTAADGDSANLTGATIQITGNYANGQDVLSFTNTANITGVFTAASGTMTLSGPDTVANYQLALRALRYNNTSENPSTLARTVTWTATDGALTSAPVTSTINIVAVNDAPVLTAGATLNYTENQAATAIDTTITASDLDSTNLTGATAQITGNYANGEDVLSFTNTANITGVFVAASGTLTLSGTDTVANYQAALRAVRYNNTSDNPSTLARTVTWIATDGALSSAAVTSTINVTAAPDGPVLTAGGTMAYTENQAANAINTAITVSDVDSTNLTGATVQITANYVNGQDILSFTNTANITGAFTAASGTMTLSGTDTVANYQAALRAVRYNNTSENPSTLVRTVTWIATDGVTPSAGVTSTITITAVNDPPVLTAGATLNYTENQAATAIDTTITAVDIDNPNLTGATAQITANLQNAQDVLSFTNTANITGVFTAATGLMTLSGTDTVANYQAALRAVRYSNTSENPSALARTVTWIATDGTLSSAAVTSTINVIPVNDPPIADNEAYDFIGNTELRVDLAAGTTPNTPTGAGTGVLTGDTDPAEGNTFAVSAITVGACTDNTVPLTCTDAAVGTVTMNINGTFSFVPAAGDAGATESFTYVITDNGTPTPATSAPATVTLTRFDRVWYVQNNSAAGGTGTSSAPFDTLVEAQNASVANDTIFVYFGTGTTNGQNAGIVLKNGQRLLGEFEGLSMPVAVNGGGSPTVLVAVPGPTACTGSVPCRPLIGNNGAGSVVVAATDAIPTVIGGFGIDPAGGASNAIDITTNAGFTGTGTLDIRNNIVLDSGAEGIDINKNGTAGSALTLLVHDNEFRATTGAALDILRTAGTLTITAFDDNVVTGAALGAGINVTGATFDATAGVPINVVSGGTTTIGASGNGVGTSGMVLTTVIGDLSFTDLDIFNDAGTGLGVTSTGALNAAVGTGFRIVVPAAVSNIDSIGGPAVSINNASVTLPLNFLRSTNSTSTGVNLVNAFGVVGATALSASSGQITDPGAASGNAVNIDGGTGNITLAIPVTNNSGRAAFVTTRASDTVAFGGLITETGTGISLTNNGGATINFTGGVVSSTGTNTAFSATGGGTVSVTGATNTLATSTGTALNVVSTTVAPAGLTFQSINSTTASANQVIVLTSTGTGPVTVTGTGTAGSGGTIDNKTDDAIRLNNTGGLITLNRMIIEDIGNMAGASNTNSTHDAIHGQDVNAGLSMTGTAIRRISDQAIHGATLAGAATVWNGLNLEGVVIEDSNRFHIANVGDANNEGSIRVLGLRGTVSVNNSTFVRGGEFFDTFVTGGTLNMTVTNSSFTNAYKEFTVGALASVGGHCIDVVVQGAGAANVTIGNRAAVTTSNTFLNCRLGSVRFVNDTGSTGNSDFIVARNTFTVNDGSSGIGGDFDFPMGGVLAWNLGNGPGGSVVDTIVENNTFTDVTNASGGVGQLTLIAEGGLLQALVQNNAFIRPGNAPWLIQSRNTVNSNARVRFLNNTITGGPSLCTTDPSCGGGYTAPGLRTLFDTNTGATMDAVLDNNSFAGHDTGFDPGQTVEFRGLAPGGGNVCVDMINNRADDGYSLENFAGTMRTVGSGTCPVGSPSAACQTVMGNRGNRGGANSLLTNPPFVNVINAAVTVGAATCTIPSGGPF